MEYGKIIVKGDIYMKCYLYGLGDTGEMYRVVYYRYLTDREISFRGLAAEAEFMTTANPSIKEVYAIFDRRGLYWDYIEAVKKNSIESWQVFKCILQYEGMKILG